MTLFIIFFFNDKTIAPSWNFSTKQRTRRRWNSHAPLILIIFSIIIFTSTSNYFIYFFISCAFLRRVHGKRIGLRLIAGATHIIYSIDRIEFIPQNVDRTTPRWNLFVMIFWAGFYRFLSYHDNTFPVVGM